MDHITKLYQNRAKVLQEEVNRLEGLLEAIVVAPPIKVDWGNKKRENKAKQQENAIDAQNNAAVDKANADAKKEEEKISFAQEHPFDSALANLIDTSGTVLSDMGDAASNRASMLFNDPYGFLKTYPVTAIGGATILHALGSPRFIPGAPAKDSGALIKTLSSPLYTHGWQMGINRATGKVDPAFERVYAKKPLPLKAGWLVDALTQRRALEAGAALEIQNAIDLKKAAEAAEKIRLKEIEDTNKVILRMASRYAPGAWDPQFGDLRDPNLAVGKVGSTLPGLRDKIADTIKSMGLPWHPENAQFIADKPNEPHKYLRSIGAITPDDIAVAKEGLKDLAMTGKEVADRSALARGARAIGASAKVSRVLPVAGAVLSAPDAIRRAKEGDAAGSIGAFAQNFDPTGTIPWAMQIKDTLEQRAKEASTLQRSAQGGTDAVEDWFARPFMDSSMTGRGSNVRQVVQPGEVSPARANYSDVVVAGSVEAPTKAGPTSIRITPEQAREMANPSGAATSTAARDALQAQKEADRQQRLRELIAQRITPSMKM
jgi:hypothetical protein